MTQIADGVELVLREQLAVCMVLVSDTLVLEELFLKLIVLNFFTSLFLFSH
jgi:hypothetical protein